LDPGVSVSGWQPRDVVTLTFSIAGLLLSLVTLYLTVLRPAALKAFIGDFLIVRLTWDGSVLIAPELAIYNAGAKVGAVFRVSGLLTSRDSDREVRLRWKTVWKAENIAGPGETAKPFWSFASFPEVIVVPSAETVTRRLMLVSVAKFELQPGTYELGIKASSGGRERDVVEARIQLRIKEGDRAWLSSHKPETEGATASVLYFRYDPKAGCYLHPD